MKLTNSPDSTKTTGSDKTIACKKRTTNSNKTYVQNTPSHREAIQSSPFTAKLNSNQPLFHLFHTNKYKKKHNKTLLLNISQKNNGGEMGIRTPEAVLPTYTISSRAP